jgi:hypothetical protein
VRLDEPSFGGDAHELRNSLVNAAAHYVRRELVMKSAIVTLLVIASIGTTSVVAQDGTGNGPPKPRSIIIIGPVPSPTLPAAGVPKVSQLKLQ